MGTFKVGDVVEDAEGVRWFVNAVGADWLSVYREQGVLPDGTKRPEWLRWETNVPVQFARKVEPPADRNEMQRALDGAKVGYAVTPPPAPLEPGDVVQLKSGGPVLTVVAVNETTGKADVRWYQGELFYGGLLPLVCLVRVSNAGN